MYCVYIMSSNSGVLYIGMTSDLQGRVAQHKSGSIPGFTATYRCRRLVFVECFDSVQDAIARERQLKGWRRSKKAKLISRENPLWADLSESWGGETVPL
jgi:putative endonuclease